ncbi:hypothetical protein LCGC14_0376790 [marine sediment metagenome]|uniref:Uncharacterized protein n=1 Tax=marine sediment metagenome TaxID=412755 RepID=A0A0F9WCA0_9ZZZZ
MASETEIINQALGRIGSQRVSDFDDTSEDNLQSVQARLHYAQTRDALLRSHWWRFARTRVRLSPNATAPDFEYSTAFDLPNDFLREWLPPWEDNSEVQGRTRNSYSLEGKQLLSNESTMRLRYVKRVEDVTEFDPLFTEVLVLQLALKFVMPIAEDKVLWRIIYVELWGEPGIKGVMSRVRTMDKQETKTVGQNETPTWNDSRLAGAGNPLKRFS